MVPGIELPGSVLHGSASSGIALPYKAMQTETLQTGGDIFLNSHCRILFLRKVHFFGVTAK